MNLKTLRMCIKSARKVNALEHLVLEELSILIDESSTRLKLYNLRYRSMYETQPWLKQRMYELEHYRDHLIEIAEDLSTHLIGESSTVGIS